MRVDLKAISSPTASFSAIALSAAVLVGIPAAPATAAPGSSDYAAWTLQDQSGTVKVANVGGEGTFIGSDANLSLASGSSAWLSATTPFGLEFGSSQGKPYLSTGIASGANSSTVTYTFADSGLVGSWAFAFGDVDAETIQVRATGIDGSALDVGYWFQGSFNYCAAPGTKPSTCSGSAGVDVPTWNPSTATLIGTGSDTQGASAWFRPNTAVATLTIEMTSLSGIPRYQTWIAADAGEATSGYYVTVAARSCPTYTDIMANKARNNIMQSLEDLGVDSIYPGGRGVPVQPSVEEDPATGQSACEPLTGWTFGFGNGFTSPDTGPYGSLTPVRGLNGTATTQPMVPLRDSLGNPTGQSLAGATTIELSATQAAIVEGGGGFTAQGGIPGLPLNGETNIAFGVLRCAVDNVNGDNVEYVNFPAGTKHVFCYAYYVDTTPEAGRITIRKEVQGPASGVNFAFSGNTSFNPGGGFTLRDGQSASFERQAGLTWTVTEDVAAPYALRDITCTGGQDVRIDESTATVDITLGVDENVECTFVNGLAATASLEVFKISENGVGAFGGTITGPNSYSRSWSAITTQEDVPVSGYDDTGLIPGTYRVSESPEPNWVTSIACGYLDDSTIISSVGTSIDVPLATDQEAVCLVGNYLDIDGGITVRSTIIGDSGPVTASSQYRIGSAVSTTSAELLTLTNTAWNAPESGSATGPLALGDYVVEGNPPADTATKTWVVDSVTCTAGGVVSGTDVAVTLDATNPDVTCDYVYRAEAVNPTVTVTKSVTGGNELRSSAVVIEVRCTTGSGPFSAVVTLPVASTLISSTVTLPKDTSSCSATETSTGTPAVVDPGTIAVTIDGSDWPEGQAEPVLNGQTVVVGAASSTGVDVARNVQGDCVVSGASVTPTVSGASCVLTFTATAGSVQAVSNWTTSNSSGSGTTTSAFAVSPGVDYKINFENSYTGTETQTTTQRRIEIQDNPATLVVSKNVNLGNSLRTGPVVLEVNCSASAAADPQEWPKLITLSVGDASVSQTITVPGNATNNDVCQVTETSSGVIPVSAGSIRPTWNGKRWKASATKSLIVGDTARVRATASTGAAVTTDASDPCELNGTRLSGSQSGTCTLRFSAQGAPLITNATTYPLGSIATTSAGRQSQLLVLNSYTATPRTIETERTVDVTEVPACPLNVRAAKSVPKRGTTLLIKSATTGDGCEITRVKVTCKPYVKTPRGDFRYCTTRRDEDGRVYITTYGYPMVEVKVVVVAEGEGHTRSRWVRTYRVTG